MHGWNPHDGGRKIDWGRSSVGYARYRPRYADGSVPERSIWIRNDFTVTATFHYDEAIPF